MKKFFKSLSLIALTLVVCLSFTACNFIDNSGSTGSGNGGVRPTTPVEPFEVELPTIPSNERKELSLVEAVSKVERSVVSITGPATGAGVIVNIDVAGDHDENYVYVLTCHHIINDCGEIFIQLPDDFGGYEDNGYLYTGRIGGDFSENAGLAVTLVGGDFSSDLALLRIDVTKPTASGKVLPRNKIVEANFASDEYVIRKGESVFAIGNPTGALPGWTSTGIVSIVETKTFVSEVGNMSLMGISVTTNPGNSGGGLFNYYGELVGITNAGNTNYDAINFAIPLYTSNAGVEGVIDNGVINIVKQLAGTATSTNYGYVPGRRVMFGFTITANNTGEIPQHTYVSAITSGSYAENVGMKVDDVIVGVKVNGKAQSVQTFNEINQALSSVQIGDMINVTVERQVRQGYRWVTVTKDFVFNVLQYHFCNTGK